MKDIFLTVDKAISDAYNGIEDASNTNKITYTNSSETIVVTSYPNENKEEYVFSSYTSNGVSISGNMTSVENKISDEKTEKTINAAINEGANSLKLMELKATVEKSNDNTEYKTTYSGTIVFNGKEFEATNDLVSEISLDGENTDTQTPIEQMVGVGKWFSEQTDPNETDPVRRWLQIDHSTIKIWEVWYGDGKDDVWPNFAVLIFDQTYTTPYEDTLQINHYGLGVSNMGITVDTNTTPKTLIVEIPKLEKHIDFTEGDFTAGSTFDECPYVFGTWQNINDPNDYLSIKINFNFWTKSGNSYTCNLEGEWFDFDTQYSGHLSYVDDIEEGSFTYNPTSTQISITAGPKTGTYKKVTDIDFPNNGECTSTQESLVGTWITGNDQEGYAILTFLDETYYVESETAGAECGTYSYNATQDQFTVTGIEFDQTPNTAGLDDALGSNLDVTLHDDILTFVGADEGNDVTFNRLVRQSNTLIGSWGGRDENGDGDVVVITFLDETHFMFSDNVGIEVGTYTWNSSTGEFQATVTFDTNSDAGFSDPAPSTINVNGNEISVTYTGEEPRTAPLIGEM